MLWDERTQGRRLLHRGPPSSGPGERPGSPVIQPGWRVPCPGEPGNSWSDSETPQSVPGQGVCTRDVPQQRPPKAHEETPQGRVPISAHPAAGNCPVPPPAPRPRPRPQGCGWTGGWRRPSSPAGEDRVAGVAVLPGGHFTLVLWFAPHGGRRAPLGRG